MGEGPGEETHTVNGLGADSNTDIYISLMEFGSSGQPSELNWRLFLEPLWYRLKKVLETFLNEIKCMLQQAYNKYLMHSCTLHTSRLYACLRFSKYKSN